jgi:hypothetical protein
MVIGSLSWTQLVGMYVAHYTNELVALNVYRIMLHANVFIGDI